MLEEYTKVTQNVGILKNAYLKEQETKVELAKKLQEVEIKCSKWEEENEILTFNNDRLTKRVAMLQDELETSQSKSSSGWFSWGGSKEEAALQEKIKLLTEELSRANDSNVELHEKMASLKEEQSQSIELLTKKMTKLKEELEIKQLEIDDNKALHMKLQDELTNEKNNALKKVKDIETTYQDLEQQFNGKKKEIELLVEKHQLEMKKARDIILRQVSFDDTKFSRLNAFNVPTFDKGAQTKLKDSFIVGSVIVNDLLNSMSVESATERERIALLKKFSRALGLDSQLISVNEKLDEILTEFNKFLSPLKDSFAIIFSEFKDKELISEGSKKIFIQNLNAFITYHQKISTSKQLILQEESKQKDCVKTTQQLNTKQQNSEVDFQNGLERILVSLTILCDIEVKSSKKEFIILFQRILESLQLIATSKKEIVESMGAKFAKEHEDAFINPKKKAINEKLEENTKATSLHFNKLLQNLGNYVSIISNPPPKPVRGALLPSQSGLLFNDHEKLQSKAEKFMTILNNQLTTSPSISYKEQLKNSEELQKLKQHLQLSQTASQALKGENEALEQERKKLLSDMALMKDQLAEKKSQLTQLLAELAQARLNIPTQPVLVGTGSKADEKGAQGKKWSMVVMDESGNQSNSLNVSEQDRERESKLKHFYLEKFTQLELQLQITDSKAIDLFQRKEKLEEQLRKAQQEKDNTQKCIQDLQKQLELSNESLESTRTNYEQQLRDFSEHVIELSSKMNSYKEELDLIKAFKVRCGKCKTWNTVEWLMGEGKNGRVCSNGNHPSSLNFA
uniref:Protein phosphatase 1 regulatory subunit 21 N-terminal domain-containing protein n=1 Tax=Arcella intermedia TaxID=1963864 RepID=A0A6B2KY86_9EUKA